MRINAKLTLDGLVRALRTKMHQTADEIEAGYLVRTEPESRQRELSTQGEEDDIIRK